MPEHLSPWFGKGVRFWQYPHQFAKLLTLLKGRPVRSYLEIGCRWGGTFIIVDQLLRELNPCMVSYAMDVIECSPLLGNYCHETPGAHYIQGDSGRIEAWETLPDQVDVIFIDGDHSYGAVRRDFNLAMKFCPHTIIIHDTASDACPDVVKYWHELKQVFNLKA